MTRLFLSPDRGDDVEPFDPAPSFLARLHRDLSAAGFDVWFDRVSMPARRLTFHQEIRDAVAAADRVVLVVGPHAVRSDYVRQEWQFALRADKVVTPILRRGEYALLPGELAGGHAEDFRDDGCIARIGLVARCNQDKIRSALRADTPKLVGARQTSAPSLGARYADVVPDLVQILKNNKHEHAPRSAAGALSRLGRRPRPRCHVGQAATADPRMGSHDGLTNSGEQGRATAHNWLVRPSRTGRRLASDTAFRPACTSRSWPTTQLP
jgi:hypothetical protein